MLGQAMVDRVPFVLFGVLTGVGAFGILMAVLAPVLRHKRRASLPKGFLAIMISFGLLHLGVIVVYLLSQENVLAFLLGELVGLFACWALLAMHCMTGGKR